MARGEFNRSNGSRTANKRRSWWSCPSSSFRLTDWSGALWAAGRCALVGSSWAWQTWRAGWWAFRMTRSLCASIACTSWACDTVGCSWLLWSWRILDRIGILHIERNEWKPSTGFIQMVSGCTHLKQTWPMPSTRQTPCSPSWVIARRPGCPWSQCLWRSETRSWSCWKARHCIRNSLCRLFVWRMRWAVLNGHKLRWCDRSSSGPCSHRRLQSEWMIHKLLNRVLTNNKLLIRNAAHMA